MSAERLEEVRPRRLHPPAPLDAGLVVPMPAWKRVMDIVGAGVLLIVLAPVMFVIMVAVMLESRGGIFYAHLRVGRGGGTFRCWKFRSMYRGADQERLFLADRNEGSGPIFKMRNDPRVTRVGRILRKTSMDELPQLWNILRGDMSLVGPRPPLPEEVDNYTPRQMLRLAGTPGLTGLWQVTARARHDFEEMTDLDLEYLEQLSFASDVGILLRTIRTVITADGSY